MNTINGDRLAVDQMVRHGRPTLKEGEGVEEKERTKRVKAKKKKDVPSLELVLSFGGR